MLYKAYNLLIMSLGSSGGMLRLVSGIVLCCRSHWESRPQEGGEIVQAWATSPEGASATDWYNDVSGGWSNCDGDTGNEDKSSFDWFYKLVNYKIVKTQRLTKKLVDTGPYKNFLLFK